MRARQPVAWSWAIVSTVARGRPGNLGKRLCFLEFVALFPGVDEPTDDEKVSAHDCQHHQERNSHTNIHHIFSSMFRRHTSIISVCWSHQRTTHQSIDPYPELS